MKIEIRHRYSGAVLFAVEAGSLKAALEIAVDQKARLDGARLDGARLDGARLDGARLDGASLDGASLDGASLDGARLDGASLDGARLDGASLNGARLDWARGIIDGGYPDGWKAFAWLDGTRGVMVKVGCRNLTMPEARAYWTGKAHRRETVAFLDYAERIAEIRGWTKPAESSSPMCDAAIAGS